MPDVEGQELILLRPGDDNVSYQFYAAPCSSQVANDGPIPYGSNVASAVITIKNDDGTEATDIKDGDLTISANVITQKMKYPATSGSGRYTIYLALTLDNIESSVVNFVLDRIKAEDI